MSGGEFSKATVVEQWRPVVGYEADYEVSDQGRVRRVTATSRHAGGYVLRQARNGDRMQVGLCAAGVRSTQKVHRLVAEAFHGRGLGSTEVCHRNGDGTDNRAVNLYWGTHAQNMQDAVMHGTHNRASRSHCKNGHPLTGENIRVRGGERICRVCELERTHAYRDRRRRAS